MKKKKKKTFTKIKCEYCKATILLYHKQKHLNKCSTKKQQDLIKKQSFYHNDINFFGDYSNYNYTDSQSDHINENKFIEKLLTKYNQIKHTLTPIFIGDKQSFDEIKTIYLNIHKNKKKLKHCKQIELIIYYLYNVLQSINIKENYFLFELGAGRASLGTMFHRFIHKFLLIVDINSKYKTKEDNRLNGKNIKKRIQCGLQHLNLNKLNFDEINTDIGNEYIAFSKHLCGRATDFGLRCVVNNNSKFECKLVGIAICCRTLCSLETYCNMNYFVNEIKLIESKEEFNLLRKMTHWGIDHQNNEKRNQIGLICRRLIDEGRVQYLKRNGFGNVKLIKYCSDAITLENMLLIASKV